MLTFLLGLIVVLLLVVCAVLAGMRREVLELKVAIHGAVMNMSAERSSELLRVERLLQQSGEQVLSALGQISRQQMTHGSQLQPGAASQSTKWPFPTEGKSDSAA